MDHQAEFKLMVLEKLGKAAADQIDWSAPRLICIAADFTKYDGHAVQQMNRNIELVRYRRFGDELLLLELANATSASAARSALTDKPGKANKLAKVGKTAGAAAKDADVISTDVFTSMGQEAEHAVRMKVFTAFCVDQALLDLANPEVVVLHCLPAHRGEEIAAEVIDGPRSFVWDQAEARLHTAKAALCWAMGLSAASDTGSGKRA